jgi:hypothetical protein
MMSSPRYAVRDYDVNDKKMGRCCRCTIVTAPMVYQRNRNMNPIENPANPAPWSYVLNDAKKMMFKQTLTQPTLNATIMPLGGIIREMASL